MNIAVNTFYKETHPGAVLQAYALCRTLSSLGNNVELVAYERAELPYVGSPLKSGILKFVTKERETLTRYGGFRSRFLRETPRNYKTQQEIFDDPPAVDALVCGSDQIWNPALLAGRCFDPVYFLQYGSPDALRISYAASFGGHRLSAEEEETLRRYLSKFTAISVREPAAAEVLSQILRRKVEVTLDPTLLIDDYGEIIIPPEDDSRYVLHYALQNNEGIRRVTRQVAAHYGLPIKSSGGPLLPWKSVGKRVEVRDPQQWLGLFANADAVVTNSFHGLVFSLLLKKRVYFPPLSDGLAARNERLLHLCNALGVSEQVVVKNVSETIRRDINWDNVARRLKEHRSSSLEFLRSSLHS